MCLHVVKRQYHDQPCVTNTKFAFAHDSSHAIHALPNDQVRHNVTSHAYDLVSVRVLALSQLLPSIRDTWLAQGIRHT